MGEAQEQAVLAVQLIIEAPTDRRSVIRAAVRAGERSELGAGALDGQGLDLIHVLIVEEEKQPVFYQGAAQRHAWIASREEWIRIRRVPSQARIGRHIVIAEVVVTGSMPIIRARSGDYVYRAASRDAGGEV